MKKEEIIIKAGIVHILDSFEGKLILSEEPVDLSSNICDFFKGHIEKITESDDAKNCVFTDTSEIRQLVRNLGSNSFVQVSKELCIRLYGIMNENIDIPAADAAVLIFSADGVDYLSLLKLNYKASYTHSTWPVKEGVQSNGIVTQRTILPSMGQKLSEAFIININSGEILLMEKKYEVNGEKKNYFSEMFLECRAPMSQKAKLNVVTKAVEQVNRKYYGNENPGREMDIRKAIYEELEEEGELSVEKIKDRVFEGSPEMQTDLKESLERYGLGEEVVKPKNDGTVKKFHKQHMVTDTGIEIIIPMEDYGNRDKVEFVNNPDGTVLIMIKNICSLKIK